MGITTYIGTIPGGVTPVCNECGVYLCFDLSAEEVEENLEFWNEWICQDCNSGNPMSLKQWKQQRQVTS